MVHPGKAGLLIATAVAALVLPSPTQASSRFSRLEARCEQRLARSAVKLVKTQLNLNAVCRARRAAGEALACPTAAAQARLSRLAYGMVRKARDACTSFCSLSENVACLSDQQCPPRLGTTGESCTGGQPDRGLDIANLGYPGPFCEKALGRELTTAADIGSCVASLIDGVAARLTDSIYGSADGPPSLSSAGATCLSALSAGARELAVVTLKTASRCRRRVNTGKLLSSPARCVDNDEGSRARVDRAAKKLRAAAIDSCTLATIAELPSCGGASGLTTPAQAVDCFVDLVKEAVHPDNVPAERTFSAPSLLEAVFPPSAVCGDGVVNQVRSASLPLGEECDGVSDEACPGKCLPPGDLFECTCGDRPRVRLFADGATSKIDSGWTGLGHSQRVADHSGFVSSLTGCDCGLIVDGECVGSTNDPICDVYAAAGPRCAWDSSGTSACQADKDCFICDRYSANPGASCSADTDCESRCYDAQGLDHAPCLQQSDCGMNEVCRGRCDRTQTCNILPNGAPLPVSAGGVAVCALQTFRTDVTGTRDLLTGAHELFYRQFTKIHLGEQTDRPCPVCGGFCEGGSNKLAVCKGRCETSGDVCRFDHDCPVADRCGSKTPECPGGHCELSLICGTDETINPGVLGRPCRVDYEDPVFGTLSNDCSPAASSNVSGTGLAIDYLPATSGTVTLPYTLPCTQQGLELYECPCPDDGGQPTAPNSCAPACDAPGPSFGRGCADGAGTGAGTVCSGGVQAGHLCDDDADCPGAACSKNPTHCTGDAAYERRPCTTNADCGNGVCGDACPGGRCVLLCVPTGPGSEDGMCAAGPPVYHCDGPVLSFRQCTQAAATGTCEARCRVQDTPCVQDADCPTDDRCVGPCARQRDCAAGDDGILGNSDDMPGAGACVADVRACFLNPIVASGGTGGLSVYDSAALWCFGSMLNGGINAASGFAGPGRAMVRGVNVPNVTSIPAQ